MPDAKRLWAKWRFTDCVGGGRREVVMALSLDFCSEELFDCTGYSHQGVRLHGTERATDGAPLPLQLVHSNTSCFCVWEDSNFCNANAQDVDRGVIPEKMPSKRGFFQTRQS